MRNKNPLSLVIGFTVLCFVAGCSHEDSEHQHDQHEETAEKHESHESDHTSHENAESSHDEQDHHDENEEHEEHEDHEDHDSQIRQAGAHLHGDAKLAIVVEGKTLFVEFDTPVYNLTGFEFAPQTAEEQAEQVRVETLLSRPGDLFSINKEASCKAVDPKEAVSLGLSDSDESGHESESDHDHEETHKDVVIEYQFHCDALNKMSEISVNLFKLFPRIEELDLVFLDQNNQQTTTLNPGNSSLKLAR